MVVEEIGEGQTAVIVVPQFCCQQGRVVDAYNGFIYVAFAFATEVEGSGLGGFEGVTWSTVVDLLRNRLDLGKESFCEVSILRQRNRS